MNRLVSINEVSADIRRNRRQFTQVSSKIESLQKRQSFLNNEFDKLKESKRLLSFEQYKEESIRKTLIDDAERSTDPYIQKTVLELQRTQYKWDENVSNEVLDLFVLLENKLRPCNTNIFYSLLSGLGKIGMDEERGIDIENNN